MSSKGPFTFVTANQGKHREVQRLLAGLDVRMARLGVPRPAEGDLETIARTRAAAAFAELREPCFLENTGLWLWDHDGAPGLGWKRLLREIGEGGIAARFGGATGEARVVVAYATSERPEEAQVFAGRIAGELLRDPRGPVGDGIYGWDRLWVPDGYDRTLAEMKDSTYVLNMRAAPYLDLAAHLLGRSITGAYEAHVTVAPCDLARFRATCDALGVKCVAIELPEGDTRNQPMTASFHRGELRAVQDEALAIGRELVRAGFSVTRTKIELHGRLEAAPETDEEARRAPETSYFEFHLKLAPRPEEDLDALAHAIRPLGGHLSRNARKTGERFVTLRAYGVGRGAAEARFAVLTSAVEARGVPIRSRIREYTVFDTNLAVDRGWT